MFIFLAFRMKAKKPNLPAAKMYYSSLKLLYKGFGLVIHPGHQDDKFPAVFAGLCWLTFIRKVSRKKSN